MAAALAEVEAAVVLEAGTTVGADELAADVVTAAAEVGATVTTAALEEIGRGARTTDEEATTAEDAVAGKAAPEDTTTALPASLPMP